MSYIASELCTMPLSYCERVSKTIDAHKILCVDGVVHFRHLSLSHSVPPN